MKKVEMEFKIDEKVWFIDIQEARFGFGEFSAYLKEGYIRSNVGSSDMDMYGVSSNLVEEHPWYICKGKYIYSNTDKDKKLAKERVKILTRKNKPTCKCHSYNGDLKETGGVKEKVLLNPFSGKTVCIDACIAKTIKALWEKGMMTKSSCCGHGGRIEHFTDDKCPSVCIPDNYTKEQIRKINRIIKNTDSRNWNIYQYKLTKVG